MPRKKKTEAPADSTPTTPGPVPEKRQTVEAIGLDRPTREIIAAAAEHGVKVSRTYVELLKKRARGDEPAKPAKAKAAKPAKAAKSAKSAPSKKPAAAPRPRKAESAAPSGGADAAFRSAAVEIVLEVGAARARELLEDVVQAIRWAAGALALVRWRK